MKVLIAGVVFACLCACGGGSSTAAAPALGGISWCVGTSKAIPAGSHVTIKVRRGKQGLVEAEVVAPMRVTLGVQPGPAQLWVRGRQVYTTVVRSGVVMGGEQGRHCPHDFDPTPP
jgi:hypothetical protein